MVVYFFNGTVWWENFYPKNQWNISFASGERIFWLSKIFVHICFNVNVLPQNVGMQIKLLFPFRRRFKSFIFRYSWVHTETITHIHSGYTLSVQPVQKPINWVNWWSLALQNKFCSSTKVITQKTWLFKMSLFVLPYSKREKGTIVFAFQYTDYCLNTFAKTRFRPLA